MDEVTLIAAARRGDLDAFNRLVLHYQTQVYNLAYRIVGEREGASDATQEAFISAWRKLGSYRGGSFKAWLLRIVTNACYDELRRRKRRPAVSLDALMVESAGPEAEAEAEFKSTAEGPETFAQRRELARVLQDCLDRLPDEMRVISVMSDVHGYNYDEIAAATGVALGTVKSRLSRARARMRECLQGFRELLPAMYRLGGETVL